MFLDEPIGLRKVLGAIAVLAGVAFTRAGAADRGTKSESFARQGTRDKAQGKRENQILSAVDV